MKKPGSTCIIVDAYSSGNLLAPEFRSRQIECAHVQSSPDIPTPARSSFHPEHFIENISHEGDLRETLEACASLKPLCVVAGSETGVELADLLSERLGLPSNGSCLSAARRDKAWMVTRVGQRCRVIPSLKTNAYDEALRWAEQRTGWPVVVKPLRSAGSDSVTTCASGEQLREAFAALLGRPDQFGNLISDVLVQERVQGPEYIVDTVSHSGVHRVTNVWSIVKGAYNGGNFVCDYNELLPYDGAGTGLLDYTCEVLDVLGMRFGPAHTELIVTRDGPTLIETAARMHGAGFPIYSRECVGYSQVDLTADAYVDPVAFRTKTQSPYELRKNLVIVELISGVEGVIKGLPRADEIRGLPSFSDMKLPLRPGDTITRTVDVFSSPGHVVLIHPDMETVRRDIAAIRQIERDGLYEVEAAP